MLPGEEVSSQRALSRAREHLVQFIVAGMTRDLPQAAGERRRWSMKKSGNDTRTDPNRHQTGATAAGT